MNALASVSMRTRGFHSQPIAQTSFEADDELHAVGERVGRGSQHMEHMEHMVTCGRE